MKKLLPLLIISFLAWLPTTDAQLTISGEDAIVCDNGTVNIDVSVSNFIDISSAQFGITWDPDVVQFSSVSNNMPASALYNTANAPIGELRFSWFDANPPPGYTPPGPPLGSQIIFTIIFNIVGNYNPDNFTAINFGSVPGFSMEIASTSGIIPNASIVIDPGSVTIDDSVPPVVTCPSNITVTANVGQPSAVVNYAAPTVTDNCLPAPAPLCSPASGSSFLIGTTMVNCTAVDGENNSSNCSFTVTVNPPPLNPNALIITATDIALNCNDTSVNIPVRVKNFDQMTSAQFALVWDELVLEFDGYTDSLNATGHSVALYNFANAPTGEFRFSWFDADGVPGEDLPDSTVIFTLHFTLLDENDLPDTVDITGVPGFDVEFSNTSGILGPGDFALDDAIVSLVPDTLAPVITCPADQTLAANANCEAILLNYGSLAIVSDNCTDTMDIVITQLPVAGTVITDTMEVRLIAQDEVGRRDTCFFMVNFVDNTPPVITCPANASFNNDAAECSAVAVLTANATDNCGILSITDNGPVGDEFPVGTTIVTFTATDVNGNSANCQTTVTVNDSEPPVVACPADQTLFASASCEATLGDFIGLATVTDNCSDTSAISLEQQPAPGTVITDTTEVLLIATDEVGLKDTCAFDVNFVDNTPPAITCPDDQTVFADAICEATLPDYTSLATAADNCTDTADIVITQSPAAGAVITDTTEVMLIAEDLAGLLDTCFFDVNFVDSLLPTIACPANDTLYIDSAQCFATLILPATTATDNCGIQSITDNGPAGDEFPVGTTIVTFTATDVNGNVANCQTTVVVNDTIFPVITCPANISQGTDAGDCSAVVTWTAPTVVDNCPNVTVTCTPPSGTTFPVGDSTVVCIVEDANGLLDTCEFVVTVFDDEDPALQCPTDTTILVPAGTVDTMINDIYLFFIGDNCGINTSYYEFTGAIPNGGGAGNDASGTVFPVGTTTVTYFAEDAAGNIDSCSFDVTIEEIIILMLDCPPNQTVANSAGNCGALVSGLTADLMPPATAIDSFYQISGATIGNGIGLDASGGYGVGVTTVTFFAVSIGGDTVSCSTTVTVNDSEAPVFTNCPSDTLTMGNSIDECGLFFNGSVLPTATDNCPGTSVSYNIPVDSLLPLGIHTIVATATDGVGLTATCSYPLEVIDNQSPKLVGCQHNSTITVNNDLNQCGAVVTWPTVTPDDNCSVFAFVLPTLGSGSFFPVGTTQATYTVVDGVGNTAVCVINVLVVDNQAPSLTCPGNQPAVNTALNQCSATVNFSMPTATDNCGSVTPMATTPTGPVFAEGVHTVAYNAMDGAGNLTACSFTVTVVDNQFPFIPNMPADFTVDTDPGDCGATVNWTLPTFPLDNCGIESFGSAGGVPGDFFDVGAHVIKYIAIDINGNITVESFTITVEDNQAPAFDCPAGVSISVDGSTIDDPDGVLTGFQQVDCDNIQLNLAAMSASDDCGIFSLVQTAGLPSGSTFPVGATLMTYVATDNNGNQTICSFVINVLAPQIAPATVSQSLVCEGGTVTFSVGTLPGATYNWTFGGNTVSNQPIFTIANAALNQAGIYTVNVTIGLCMVQFVTELTVSALPVVTIDANDILCSSNGLPLVITATNSSTANVTNWVWTYPDGSLHPGQTQTIPNPTITDSGIYCITATTAFGCSTTVCQQIDVSSGPTTPILNGTTSSACVEGDKYFLFGQLYSGTNVEYHWYAVPATGSGLTTIDNPIISIDPTLAGTYTYYFYVIVDGCTSDTAGWVVNVSGVPNIVLGLSGETQCVDGTTNVTLTDTGSGGTTWTWTAPDGTTLAGNSSVVLQNVTSSFSGLYQVEVSNFQCTNTASINVVITDGPSPDAQLTASDNSICEGEFVTLTGTSYTGTVTYVWTGDNVPPGSQNQSEITVFPSAPGNYMYSFAAIVNGCSTDVVLVNVVVEAAPVIDIVVTGEVNCVDGTSSITLTTTATGISTWEWTDENGNVLSTNSDLVLSNIDSADSGTYCLSTTNSFGCFGFACTTLNITDGIDGLSANMNNIDCVLGALNLEASSIPGATYQWFTPGGQPFSTEQNPTIVNGQASGEGIYTVVANVGGCTDSAFVDVDLLDPLDANDKLVLSIIDVPQEFNILAYDVYEPGQPFTINILQQTINGTVTYVSEDSIYLYTPNSGFWGNDFLIYEICYTDCPGVCDIAMVTFQVNYSTDQCVITTVISPNDDGVNDNFVVSCLEVQPPEYPLNTLVIFNQWGDQVYDAAPYNNDWMGTYDGKDLPDGTYFYIFQREPGEAPQKGFVMIYR